MSNSYYQFVESVVLKNEITPKVSSGFKRDVLLPYLLNVLPTYSTEELCTKTVHVEILKNFELRTIIHKDQHSHKNHQALIFFGMIALYKSRDDGQYIEEKFTEDRFGEFFPTIVNTKPRPTMKLSISHLVKVWETFVVAIDMMKMKASGKKGALMIAANLFCDPHHNMTLGGKPTAMTNHALYIYYSVSGVETVPRPNRRPSSQKRRIQVENTSDSECSISVYSNNQVAKRYKQHGVLSDDATIQTWNRDEMSYVSSLAVEEFSDNDSVSLDDLECDSVDDQEYRELVEMGLDFYFSPLQFA